MHQRVLYIGHNWPELHTTAAGRRTFELIEWFLSNNAELTFVSAAQNLKYSSASVLAAVQWVPIELNKSSFDSFLTTLNPDIVVFDRFLTEEQFGARVHENCPRAMRILDTMDLHSLRQARQEGLKEKNPFNPLKWLALDITKREIASIYRSDLSLIISKYEIELLKKYTPLDKHLLLYLPFKSDNYGINGLTHLVPFEKRKDFMFVGNGRHQPNIDGLIWLIQDIWPTIRKAIPEAELHIYGPYMPQKVVDLFQRKNGVIGMGWVKNLKQATHLHRVNLIPLTYGAGLKGKLLDSLENSIPLVSTSIGIEGFEGAAYLKNQIADNSKDFAELAISHYIKKQQWTEALSNGQRMLEKLPSNRKWENKLSSKISKIHNNLELHRNSNILGRILISQQYNSGKYMTKWIELKNKLKT